MMTNWYEKLKTAMQEAIAKDNQGRALSVACAAWECMNLRRITRDQALEINGMYDAWEKTWAE